MKLVVKWGYWLKKEQTCEQFRYHYFDGLFWEGQNEITIRAAMIFFIYDVYDFVVNAISMFIRYLASYNTLIRGWYYWTLPNNFTYILLAGEMSRSLLCKEHRVFRLSIAVFYKPSRLTLAVRSTNGVVRRPSPPSHYLEQHGGELIPPNLAGGRASVRSGRYQNRFLSISTDCSLPAPSSSESWWAPIHQDSTALV